MNKPSRTETASDIAEPAVLGSLPAQTRRSQIAATLRNAIFAGQLPPGSALVEVKLAQQLGVSRAPLREAIRELTEEGLLLNRPYVGTYVVEISAKTLREAYDLRRVLERHAFELIWDRRDKAFEKELLRRHAQLVDAADSGDMYLEIAAEMSFHRFPYEFSRSGVLLEMWEILSQKIRLGFTLYQQSIGEPTSSRNAHNTYVQCALSSDISAMHAEIDRHIDAGVTTVLGYLRQTRDE
jgi:DNA-binding GntR family transcriptional regulator